MNIRDAQGVINNATSPDRRTDYLYRLSLKGLILNESGELLVVKETGRDWWDLPGGGMDHGEDIKTALARELNEEINLNSDFTYQVINVENPKYLENHDFWQVRIIFAIKPENMEFSPGPEADEIEFADPYDFENSSIATERWIFEQFKQLNCAML